MLSTLSELNLLLDELRDIASGHIKIGIPPLIGTLFFPKIAGDYNKEFPKVTLELVEHGAKVIGSFVEDGEIDLGIIVLPADEKNLISIHLFKMNLFFICMKTMNLHKEMPSY